MNTIPAERLKWLEKIALSYGSHPGKAGQAACVMEAVAYVAGEPHSDHPRCACPILTRFCITLNDRWASSKGGAERVQQLKPYVVRLVGTRSTLEIERRRAFMAVDWAIRECLPMAFRAPTSKAWQEKMSGWPAKLRALPEIRDEASARAGRGGPLTIERMTLDRIVPGKKGGKYTLSKHSPCLCLV